MRFTDSINTIILLENINEDLGAYSNGTTRAILIKTEISFIDKKTMNLVSKITISGEEPPLSITFRNHAPDSYYGKCPSVEDIMGEIKNELK